MRIVVLAAGFGLFELVVGLSYASVDQNAIRQLVDALPPALRALAGSADISTPTGYAGSGYLHPVALALPAAAAISMAAAPARDVEDGTAELILSRPIQPPRWLAAHALAMATGLAAVVAGGYLGGLVASEVVDDLAPVNPGRSRWPCWGATSASSLSAEWRCWSPRSCARAAGWWPGRRAS